MATVTLKKGGKELTFSPEHAQNILNSSVNAAVKGDGKYTLADSAWEMKDGKLSKKVAKKK